MKIDEKDILSRAAKSFADESLQKVILPVEPKTRLGRILTNLGLRKRKELVYHLRKIKVGNRKRIAARAVKLPSDIFSSSNIIRSFFHAGNDFTDDLIYITAVALQNDRHEPSEELLDALRWLDDDDFFTILDKSLSTLNIQAFMSSIALIVGVEDLKEKPTTAN